MIDPKRVNEIFMDCLLRKDEEDTGNYVEVEGIMNNVRFHPDRLESHKSEIKAILDELPEQFRESGGGGWSFLSACYDKHGNQWTGLHSIIEQLFLLGIGIDKVKCLFPREMWSALPGGMPYYSIAG